VLADLSIKRATPVGLLGFCWPRPAERARLSHYGVHRIRRELFALGMKNNETLAMSDALDNHFSEDLRWKRMTP